MHRLTDVPTEIAVRTRLAGPDAAELVTARAQGRLDRLRDETGAQAAEYAMLGGVSAAVCGVLIWLLKETDVFTGVVKAIFDALTNTIGSWF